MIDNESMLILIENQDNQIANLKEQNRLLKEANIAFAVAKLLTEQGMEIIESIRDKTNGAPFLTRLKWLFTGVKV